LSYHQGCIAKCAVGWGGASHGSGKTHPALLSIILEIPRNEFNTKKTLTGV